jgi:hypothetical protein
MPHIRNPGRQRDVIGASMDIIATSNLTCPECGYIQNLDIPLDS